MLVAPSLKVEKREGQSLETGLLHSPGRRVPTNKSVDNPTVNEIVEVCKRLGLTAELEVRLEMSH